MAAENEASQESALGAYSPVDYMSITSFPRLPEDEPAPAVPLRGRKDEDAFLGDPDTGEARWPSPCPLGRPRPSSICAEHHLQLHLPNLLPSSRTSSFSLSLLIIWWDWGCISTLEAQDATREDAGNCSRRDWGYPFGRAN